MIESGAGTDDAKNPSKPMSLLFFGFLADPAELARAYASEPMPQVSAVKFQSALIEGLTAHGVELDVLSALPIASYPRSTIAFYPGSEFSLGSGKARGLLMPGTNLPIVKLPIRFALGLFHGYRRLAKGIGAAGIIVYSVHTPFIAAALLLKRVFKVPVFVFIPDLPMHMAGAKLKGVYGAVKGLDNWLLRTLVSKADMAFPFAAGIAQSWLPPSVKYMVVEGIAPQNTSVLDPPPRRTRLARPVLLYTGHFSHILRFATMFSARTEIDASLVFVGDGPDGQALQVLSQSDDRIVVKPFATGDALAREFEEADFLLNPRDSQWEGASLSFPSKLHDYMGRNRPILSTRMPAIPGEYFDCFFAVDDDNADNLSASIRAALQMSPDVIERRVRQGETMLRTTKSPSAVAGQVLEAMRDC